MQRYVFCLASVKNGLKQTMFFRNDNKHIEVIFFGKFIHRFFNMLLIQKMKLRF